MISSRSDVPDIVYYAYLRVKDFRTGKLLYYCEDPVIDYGKDWNRQAIDGAWITINEALQGSCSPADRSSASRGATGSTTSSLPTWAWVTRSWGWPVSRCENCCPRV